MAFGLVLGTDGNRCLSVEWDPAEETPSDALIKYANTYPDAKTWSVVETQCDGTIRPVDSGLMADIWPAIDGLDRVGSAP